MSSFALKLNALVMDLRSMHEQAQDDGIVAIEAFRKIQAGCEEAVLTYCRRQPLTTSVPAEHQAGSRPHPLVSDPDVTSRSNPSPDIRHSLGIVKLAMSVKD